MAKQIGDVILLGRYRGLTGFKDSEGIPQARSSNGVDGNKVRNAPEFERTRENNAEFKTAADAASLLYRVFKEEMGTVADRTRIARLRGKCVTVIRTDRIHIRGQRGMNDGELSALNNFDFNRNNRLSERLPLPVSTMIDRSSGSLSVYIPPLIPQRLLTPTEYATHFRLTLTAAKIDFVKGTSIRRSVSTSFISTNSTEAISFMLSNHMPVGTGHLFLLLGIQFFREEMGAMRTTRRSRKYNALSIVAAEPGDNLRSISHKRFQKSDVVKEARRRNKRKSSGRSTKKRLANLPSLRRS